VRTEGLAIAAASANKNTAVRAAKGAAEAIFARGLVRNSRFTYWSAVDDNNRPQLINFA